VADAVSIDDFLAREGFATAWAKHQGRAILEQAGLTRAGKSGIAPEKLQRAREALARGALRTCGDAECARLGARKLDGRLAVEGPAEYCEVCHGSNNRRAALVLADACRSHGVSRLLIVGGTPANHADLQELLTATGVELRCVDGAAQNITKKEALSDLGWAQLMVVWASTPLPHKVSVSFTTERPPALPMITVARRGIAALCQEAALAVAGGPVSRRRRQDVPR